MPKAIAAKDQPRTAEQENPLAKIEEPTVLDSIAKLFFDEAAGARFNLVTTTREDIEADSARLDDDPEDSFTCKQRWFHSTLDAWLESLVAVTKKYAQTLKDIVGRHPDPEVVGRTGPPQWVRSQLEQLLEKELGYEISGVKRDGWWPKPLSSAVSAVLWFFYMGCDPEADPHLLVCGLPANWCAPPWCSMYWSFGSWVGEGKPERLSVGETEELVRAAETEFAMRLSYVLGQIEHEVRVALALSQARHMEDTGSFLASDNRTSRPLSRAPRRQDARKLFIAAIKSRGENEAKKIACRLDEAIEKMKTTTEQLEHAPLKEWQRFAPKARTWEDFLDHPQTHKRVKGFINKVPRLQSEISRKVN